MWKDFAAITRSRISPDLNHPTCDHDAVRFGLRVDKLTLSPFRDQPGKQWTTPFELRVKYKPKLSEGAAERIGEPSVVAIDKDKRLDPDLIGFVLEKFGAFFLEKLHPDGFAPVEGGFLDLMTKIKIA